jgi:hypothetical protein
MVGSFPFFNSAYNWFALNFLNPLIPRGQIDDKTSVNVSNVHRRTLDLLILPLMHKVKGD